MQRRENTKETTMRIDDSTIAMIAKRTCGQAKGLKKRFRNGYETGLVQEGMGGTSWDSWMNRKRA